MHDVKNPDEAHVARVAKLIDDLSQVIGAHLTALDDPLVAVDDAFNAARHLYAKTAMLAGRYDEEALAMASVLVDKSIAKLIATEKTQ